jgi:hypothetical protein
MELKIPNSFWFRHFLLCDKFAKEVCSRSRGWEVENFAKCVMEEEAGMYANNQMTIYFWSVDSLLAELHESDYEVVFEYLEIEEDIDIDTLAKLTKQELDSYYGAYCIGKTIMPIIQGDENGSV